MKSARSKPRSRPSARAIAVSADDLPPAYAGFRIATYRDRVQAKGSWNKLAVVAAETDTDTILNHALIQLPWIAQLP